MIFVIGLVAEKQTEYKDYIMVKQITTIVLKFVMIMIMHECVGGCHAYNILSFAI